MNELTNSGNAFQLTVRNPLSCLQSDCTNIKMHRTVILPVLHRCEIWSLKLREELRQMLFENTDLRKIFGSKRLEKMRNEVLHDSYTPNIIRVIKSMRWAGHVVRIGENKNKYRVLVWKSG